MSEFLGASDKEPMPDKELTLGELLERALSDGWIEPGDQEYFGDDVQDVLTGLYSYILQAGGDPDEVFATWGVAFEPDM